MSMGLNLNPVQAQTTNMEQILQIRRIQMMRVLQLPQLGLQEYLEQMFEENPCLEIREKTLEPEDHPERTENRNDKEGERFERLDSEDNSYYEEQYSRPSRSVQEEMSEKHHEFLENIPAHSQTLPEFLQEQAAGLSLTDEQAEAVDRIIFSLDDRGFLVTPLEDLFGKEPEMLQRGQNALKVVQSMEPTGVGARDLKECLLLQIASRIAHPELREEEIEGDRVSQNGVSQNGVSQNGVSQNGVSHPKVPDYLAMQLLLSRYSKDLECNNIPKISRESGLKVHEIYQLLQQLSRLNPNPGRDFTPRSVGVTPDIFCVRDENNQWTVTLDEHDIPQLYVNTHYGKSCRTSAEREFVHRSQNAAKWLLEAIQMRRETLLAVGDALVKYQSEFLEKGPRALKPLTEKQLALQIGKHPSTVSRAIKDKWIQTPFGLFPLSDFFSASVLPSQAQAAALNNENESASRDAIKQLLVELIQNEDKSSPYSDDELAEKLNIARTTINKYRKELNIPSSRQRKIYK